MDNDTIECPRSPNKRHQFNLLGNLIYKADFYCVYCLGTVTKDYVEESIAPVDNSPGDEKNVL